MRALMWFRADLRVRDNTALHAACAAASDGVVAVFTICPDQWLSDHDWADVKVGFILRCLEALKVDLAKLDIPLRILTFDRFDDAAKSLLGLAGQFGCDELYFNDEYEFNERERDAAVEKAFVKSGRAVRRYTDQTLFTPGDVRTGSGGAYTVYTPFKKNCWGKLDERLGDGDFEVLGRPKKQKALDVRADEVPASVKGFDTGADRPDLWGAGEKIATGKLSAFIQHRIESYKDKRDTPSIEGTSSISPYLAMGCVSPRACLQAAVDANGGKIHEGDAGCVGWIEEILWREFYKHILVAFPHVNKHRSFRREYDALEWRDDVEALDRWKEGRTGYPIVDAGMRQLKATGWMHNRVRMIVATMLTKHLLLDWRLGEKHFMRHLIDGDLGSNNGGWQWSASVGTDAAPYFRVFNPFSQSRKFDADGAYIRRYVPELESLDSKKIHAPHGEGPEEASLFSEARDYPKPIVNQKKARTRAIDHFKAFREG